MARYGIRLYSRFRFPTESLVITFDSEDDIPEECTQPAICIETINMFLKYIEEYKEKLFQGKEQWKP